MKRCRLILYKCLQVPLQVLLQIAMTLNLELRYIAVENGEIYGISDINFTIASFAANGRSLCGVVTPERVAMSKTSQWGLSKTREINFTIASFAANGHAKHSLPSVGKPTAPLGQRSSLCRVGCDKQNETNFGKRILKRKTNYEKNET